MWRFLPLLLGLVLLGAACVGSSSEDKAASSQELRFSTAEWETDFARHTVPLAEFVSGGKGKNRVPAIERPNFESVSEAGAWLEAREPVIELVLDDEARAYPLKILIWHEIVNDVVAGTPVAVTFCPLCNTAVVLDRRVDDRALVFGTSGNLRNADLVMFDFETESWWQQFTGEAVVGEFAGKQLRMIPARIVAWEEFARVYPDGRVLSIETGFLQPYGENPYPGYDDVDSSPLFDPANQDDDRLSPKERVVFIERNDEAVAVPFSVLEAEGEVEIEVGGDLLVVSDVGPASSVLDAENVLEGRDVISADVRLAETGERVVFDVPFWFAVAAFAPDIEIVRG